MRLLAVCFPCLNLSAFAPDQAPDICVLHPRPRGRGRHAHDEEDEDAELLQDEDGAGITTGHRLQVWCSGYVECVHVRVWHVAVCVCVRAGWMYVCVCVSAG